MCFSSVARFSSLLSAVLLFTGPSLERLAVAGCEFDSGHSQSVLTVSQASQTSSGSSLSLAITPQDLMVIFCTSLFVLPHYVIALIDFLHIHN